MDLTQVDAFFTDMATLWHLSGIDGLRQLIPVVGYPMLRLAFEWVCADIDHDELCRQLEARLEEEMQQIEQRHRMVTVGIRAVRDLKSPEETARLVRQVAA